MLLAGSSEDLDPEAGTDDEEASDTDADITIGELENPVRMEDTERIRLCVIESIHVCTVQHDIPNLAEDSAPIHSMPTRRYEDSTESSSASLAVHEAPPAPPASSSLPE